MNSKLNSLIKTISIFFLLTLFSACASTTHQGSTGVTRSQLMILPAEEINASAAQSYEQTTQEARAKNALDVNKEYYRRVNAIAKKIIPQTAVFRQDALDWKWDIHVISSNELNAYCMPGGKIIFYSGIIEKLNLTDGEIAAIMGHEIAHALREHGRERLSEEIIKQKSLQLLVLAGTITESHASAINTLSSIVLTLPHGREQESEADVVGTELMARAGYNPKEAVNLWKKMSLNGGGGTPEILSTHPSDSKRIEHITSLLPQVMPLYEKTIKK